MREIKFRAETLGGQTLTGGYSNGFLVKEMRFFAIKKGTLAQLVGVDKNGAEVYEGDTLLDELEQEYIAALTATPELKGLKLK
ncbi:MAG: hypothetical protein SR3Q1_09040 [Quinella sp. 3Q1]|nr:hypothetical protein [Quinella sp. 3Q1]